MILLVKEHDDTTCQENDGYEAIYNLRYRQGSGMSTAGYGMQKTDQDIGNYPVLKSIAFTCNCSSLE